MRLLALGVLAMVGALLAAVLLASGYGAAQQAAVRLSNASFEEGDDGKPVGWTASGAATWGEGEAAEGSRFLTVEPGGAWTSDPVAFEPGAVYELRFRCRYRPEAMAGSAYAAAGPAFAIKLVGLSLDDAAPVWREHAVRFVAPTPADPAASRIGLTQWDLKGAIDFDDLSLHRVLVAHRTRDGVTLGEGETVEGNSYRFEGPLGRWRASRALEAYSGEFHDDRWRLPATESYVTYRHEVAGRRQTRAAVSVSVWFVGETGWGLTVEASTDGQTWHPVGTIRRDKADDTFELPAALFPAEVVRVRLRCDRPEGAEPGLLQVTGYRYEAELDGAPTRLQGASSLITLLDEDPTIAVEPLPTEDDRPVFQVRVTNRGAQAVTADPVLTVTHPRAGAQEYHGERLELAPGDARVVAVPYAANLPGVYELRLTLGGGLRTALATSQTVCVLQAGRYGERLASPDAGVALWWASSGWKVSRDRPVPEATGDAVRLSLAGNEAEGAQIVIRPDRPLRNVTANAGELRSAAGNVLPASSIEVLRVRYVTVDRASDETGGTGDWPDPLPPFRGGIPVAANENQPLWVCVRAPKDAKPGLYRGTVSVVAEGFRAEVPVEVEVFGFALPDETSCRSLLGLGCWGPGRVFSYHRAKTDADRRSVYEQYLRSFGEHRISPYDPAALDGFTYAWDTGSPWEGGQIVTGEAHTGERALCIRDDRETAGAEARHRELLPLSGKPVKVSLWYRTAQADQPAEIIVAHCDAARGHIAYRNQHIALPGATEWTLFEQTLPDPPPGAAFIQPVLEGAPWTPGGEKLGTAWVDDVSLVDTGTGAELLEDGGFEAARPVGEDTQVAFDWSAWDAAMERAVRQYHFSGFVFGVPGLGSGTFYSRAEGEVLGYRQDTPEYQALFRKWCDTARAHLADRGLLDKAVCYPFDEPGEKDYPFVVNQLRLLRENFPGLHRMVPMNLGAAEAFVGTVDFWCPLLNSHNPRFAQERRRAGDLYCWYICCAPKVPYIANFIDRPATDLRVWLWQTWQQDVDGILIWETAWWTSGAAYPDGLQNPYEDSMSWVDGYGTPRGEKRAWNAGDGRFLYPPEACFDGGTEPVLEGPVSTIRWEALRDGMEDFEYLALLRRLLTEKREGLTAEQAARYEALLTVPATISGSLTSYTQDPAPIEARRTEIARAIEALTGGP